LICVDETPGAGPADVPFVVVLVDDPPVVLVDDPPDDEQPAAMSAMLTANAVRTTTI